MDDHNLLTLAVVMLSFAALASLSALALWCLDVIRAEWERARE